MQNKLSGIYQGALRAPWERQACENRPPVQARRVFRSSDQTGKRSALERHRDAPEGPLGVTSESQRGQIDPFLEEYAWFSLRCAYFLRNGAFRRQREAPKIEQKWYQNGPKRVQKRTPFWGPKYQYYWKKQA